MTPKQQASLDNRLIEAAKGGHTETVQALLAAGADLDAVDEALCWAAYRGCTETVDVLLAGRANVHADDDRALRWAAKYGHTETVKVLLTARADVHAKNDFALRWAACHGHTETVKVLVAHIFAPESWRGKSRAETEAGATALYDTIKADNTQPEYLHKVGTILVDCALDCWFQVRPPPPKFQISPLPAQPRPL
jgi:ankyrin repeat protein